MNIKELIKGLDVVQIIELKNYLTDELSNICGIKNSNSKIISLGNDSNIVEKAYGVTLNDNTAMLENVVSRKKQMLPKILENLD